MKELYLLMEEEEMSAQHSDNKACAGDSWTQNTVCPAPSSPARHPLMITPCRLSHSPDCTQGLQMVVGWEPAHQLLRDGGRESSPGSDRRPDEQ